MTTMMPMPTAAREIRGFQDPHRWLSSFWPARVRFDDVWYPTVEHAYVAAKTLLPHERQAVLACQTPGQAKRLGRTLTLRPDWDRVKISIMLDLVRQKFAQDPLRRQLLDTGQAEIVEDNAWGDRFWGVCRGEGQNWLGRLIMQVRDELREPQERQP